MVRRLFLVTALILGVVPAAEAQWTSARADGHAPIAVMADHVHKPGELMLAFRFMNMTMEGSRVGTSTVSDPEIVSPTGPYQYIVTPTKMPMRMYMFGAMLGTTKWLTAMAMLPVLDYSMDHLTRAGGTFTTNSSGIGDLKLSGLVPVTKWDKQFLMGQLGVSIPTGSINKKDVTPASDPNTTQLPYPMQVGSGTWDLLASLTYQGQMTHFSWGAQADAVLRTGTNSNGYRLGNRYSATAWAGVPFAKWLSASLQLTGLRINNIAGADSTLAAPMGIPPAQFVPTANPNLRAGSYGTVGLGINTYVPSGPLHDLRISVEGMLPFYQKLDGPQLETDWVFVAGVQWTTKLWR